MFPTHRHIQPFRGKEKRRKNFFFFLLCPVARRERERERKRGAEELSDPFFVSLLKYRERERKWFKEPLGWQSSEPIGWVDPPPPPLFYLEMSISLNILLGYRLSLSIDHRKTGALDLSLSLSFFLIFTNFCGLLFQ